MSLIIDKEADLSKEDLLTTKVYADTLKDLILNAPENEPLTIGLFGPWGSGKSSIIGTLKADIGNAGKLVESQLDAGKNTVESATSRIAFVVYDAWKYANDSFRRTFLITLQNTLKVEPALGMENFYKSSSEETEISMLPNKVFLYIAGFFLLAGIFRFYSNPNPTADWPIAAVAAFLSYTTGVLTKMFLELKKAVQTPVMGAPELFEKCFNQLIDAALVDKVIGKSSIFSSQKVEKAPYEKVVIVIDNIDRCSKESAYEMLTNTKNFIGSHYQVIFLLPMDEDALKKHLFKGESGPGDQGEEFLRKYFNVVVRMKNFRNSEIFDFANNINLKNKLGLERDTVNIIAREYAKNPRRIIQFYNNLSAELQMMTLKHKKAFCKTHEAAICKFLIIREEWPQKYREICSNPKKFLESNPSSYIEARNGGEREMPTADSYESFLDSTYVSTRNLKIEELMKILLNADNYESFPENLAQAAAMGDPKKIKEVMKELDYTKDMALNPLLFRLKSAVDNELFDTDVSETMDQLMGFLIANPGTEKTFIERIETITSRRLHRILPSSKSFERLIAFNKLALKKNLSFIEEGINIHFKDFSSDSEDKFQESDYALYRELIRSSNENQTKAASGFFARYLKAQPWGARVLKDLRSDQFDILYSAETITEVFFDRNTPVWLDHNFEHWKAIIASLSNPEGFVGLLLANTADNIEEHENGKQTFISKFGEILNLIPTTYQNEEGIKRLHNINDQLFIKIGNKSSYLSTLVPELRVETFKYILESYRFTNGSVSSAGWITEFIKIFLLPEFAGLLANFVDKHKSALDFSGLKSLATGSEYIDADIHALQMQMMYINSDGNNLFGDEELLSHVGKLATNLVNYPEYNNYLADHLRKDRIKNLMIPILKEMTREEFNLQPKAYKNLIRNKPRRLKPAPGGEG